MSDGTNPIPSIIWGSSASYLFGNFTLCALKIPQQLRQLPRAVQDAEDQRRFSTGIVNDDIRKAAHHQEPYRLRCKLGSQDANPGVQSDPGCGGNDGVA